MKGIQGVTARHGKSGKIGRIIPTYAYVRAHARARVGKPLKATGALYLKLSQISSLSSLSSHRGKKKERFQRVAVAPQRSAIFPRREFILPIIPRGINIWWVRPKAYHILERGLGWGSG